MVVRQPLFEQNDTTDQTAVIFRLLFQQLISSRVGILSETAFEVTQRVAGADASVDVKSGGVMVAGNESANQGYYYIINDKDINVPRPAMPSTSSSRLDTVIIRARDSTFPSGQLDVNTDDAVLEWVVGTATSGTPSAPDLDALGYKNYYKLANISVPAGSPNTPVTSSNITDLRTLAIEGRHRAVGVGGITICTSSTRPSTPRFGEVIWEENTKNLLINEGAVSANWIIYGVSNLSRWQSFSSGFPISGTGIKTWGRYLKIGSIVFGTTGFRFSATGSADLSGQFYCRLPVKALNPNITGLMYIGGGRAYDSTGLLQGTFWSGTASITQNDSYLRLFATQGLPIWDATHPFNWGSGTSFQKADQLEMFFCYEAAS